MNSGPILLDSLSFFFFFNSIFLKTNKQKENIDEQLGSTSHCVGKAGMRAKPASHVSRSLSYCTSGSLNIP